jgi:hypothetical protein
MGGGGNLTWQISIVPSNKYLKETHFNRRVLNNKRAIRLSLNTVFGIVLGALDLDLQITGHILCVHVKIGRKNYLISDRPI